MTIEVSSSHKISSLQLPVREGQRIEFKTSAFYAPSNEKRQTETIAKEIAAFMNADGGDLYLGVNDDGFVTGIQSDLDALKKGFEETFVQGKNLDDSKWVDSFKKANEDAYARKINQIVEGYLGQTACQLLDDVEFQNTEDGYIYARVPVRRSDIVVYFQTKKSSWSEVYVRTQGKMLCYRDKDRDEFIAGKARKLAHDENVENSRRLSEQMTQMKELFNEFTKINLTNQQIEITTKDSLKQPVNEVVVKCGSKDVSEELFETSIPTCPTEHTLERVYDSTTSVMDVMDEFDKKDGELFQYQRLILKSHTGNMGVIPYEYRPEEKNSVFNYIRIKNGDYFIDECALVIERPKQKIPYIPSEGVSFSELKKGFLKKVGVCLLKMLKNNVFAGDPFDKEINVRLEKHIGFFAFTTEKYSHSSEPNVYSVIGVKLKKRELFYRPDGLASYDYLDFKLRNGIARKASEEDLRHLESESRTRLEQLYDSATSVTRVIDLFDEKENDRYKYSSLLLKSKSNAHPILPYVEEFKEPNGSKCYHKIQGVDYKLTRIAFVIERIAAEDVEKIHWSDISFTDLKKGYLWTIEHIIQESLKCQKVYSIKDNLYELYLTKPVILRANTSKSFGEHGPAHPNFYKIVAVQFEKKNLLFKPDILSEDEYYNFGQHEFKKQQDILMMSILKVLAQGKSMKNNS